MFSNQLFDLPPWIFDGLTALTTLRLGGNAVDPLSLIVSLQSVGEGEFRAVITTGAPFNVVLPISVTNGSISGGITSVTIPQGSAASAFFTVIGTSAKVSFGYLPGLPSNHYGYMLTQSTACNRTEAVADAIAKAVGVTDCSALTEVDLATITSLDISGVSLASLAAGDFDGMLSLRSLYLGNNELTGLPSGIFDDLVSLRELFLSSNKLTTLPGGIFSNLTSLTNLYLQGNDLSSLSSSVFDGLSSLKHLGLEDNELTSLSGSIFVGIPDVSSILLSKNKLTSLPAGIFEGLSSLSQLHLSANSVEPLPLVVSLQKVGTNQFKAVAPTGAPFAMALPVTVQNGTIAGGTTTITIPIGRVESQPVTVTRTPGAVNAVTANIGNQLPRRPATHNGYVLVKSTTLPIEVIPPLNSPPVFTEGATTTDTIAENTAAGTNIGDAVIATDVNTGDTLTYTLGGTDAAAFDIDSATGQLKTKAALDYETQNAYSIVLTVSDGRVTDTITVTIKISNVNEAPIFAVGSSTTHTVAENTAAGENIGSPVSATDDDGDTLSYSLSGTDASSFSIDSTIGQLKTGAALNFEDKSSYTFTITVSDGTFTDTITVTINVTDANDAPIFTDGESISRSVAENTATGNNIGSVIAATDADNDTLTYSLGGTDAGVFGIVSTTGQLQTSAALDSETKSSYSVTVSVSDVRGGTDSITVTINVTDVSEGTTTTRTVTENTAANTNIGSEGTNNAPVFADGTTTTRTVAENTAANTNIGSAVSATDADSDTLTYTLSGTDASSFSIVSTSGQLQTSAALDYETKSSYSVTVSVSDGNGGTDSITVTINVTDVSDGTTTTRSVTDVTETSNNAPMFTDGSSTTRTVAENTAANTNIGSAVSATDADNDTLTYTLGGTDAALFSIVSTSGQLQTSAALDSETKSSYSVTVSVSDVRGGTDSITVTINVTDVSEGANIAPVFTDGTSTTRTVAENTAANTNIGSAVSATDTDNDTLTYSLGGTDAALFSIVSTSGQLQTSAALDSETKSSYSVTVSVSDVRGGTDSITVTINVTDVSEGANIAPVFTDGTSTTRTVAENTAANTNIGSAVSATDTDNDTLTYSLGGTDAALFSIVSTSGQLQTSAALDSETKSSYSVTVSVSDVRGGTDSITVTINVTDVSEGANIAPVFTDGTSTTRTVAENTAANTNIGSAVSATDADSDTLTYTLGGTDAASFSIVSTSGQLQTSAALDYETTTSYSVTVSVSDVRGGTDSITVTINVTDVTEAMITLISDRTQQVQDAIVAAVQGVDSAADVTATHLTAITSLNLYRKSITSLKAGDFAGLTALTTLYLENNSIIDISPLENLTNLTKLELGFNSIIDISPLENLTNLTTLELFSNSISDISPLENLTNLTTLDLGFNSIIDISPLENLTNLTTLDLSGNNMSDISSLEDLTNLTTLLLFSNSISNISPLEDLTNLTKLDLSFNSISDISPLEDLTNLTKLNLSFNSISDISPLENLTSLTALYLEGNTISDYGPLRRLIAAIEAIGDHPGLTIDITIPEEDNGAPTLSAVPTTTALLANFPNPFNPETWIPYQLSKSAKVTLTIYSMRGVVVRQLELGHKPAGVYLSRSRAVHWDGRNMFGEKVAAGVYFYTLEAGDFTATRKMLIRK